MRQANLLRFGWQKYDNVTLSNVMDFDFKFCFYRYFTIFVVVQTFIIQSIKSYIIAAIAGTNLLQPNG